VLIIEEINRGDCAAIFGAFFQLLDRASSGKSEYAVKVDAALSAYLSQQGVDTSDGVALPPNLSLFATMNTADQNLFPMDAAFKRRWAWRSVPIMSGSGELDKATIAYGTASIPWTDFVGALNSVILQATDNEDKQIGPWYVRFETDGGFLTAVREADLRDKLLFYLWHDVFRNHRDDFFDGRITRFDDLQATYDESTIRGVLSGNVRTQLDDLLSQPASDTLNTLAASAP
jgi:hypothetical protein